MRLVASVRSALQRHPLLIVGSVVALLVVGVVVIAYFEPQKLIIDQEVDEGLPTAAQQPDVSGSPQSGGASGRRGVRTISGGAFRSLAHEAEGDARVIEVDDRRFLRFENFKVENGPDLRVYLSAAPVTSSDDALDDDFVELGELKGNVGDQNYEIPESTELERFHSAVIWCKRFSVGFAAAPLE